MEYKVVFFVRNSEVEAITALERQVTRLLATGWKTQGGVSVTQDSSNFYHVYQAMVKEK